MSFNTHAFFKQFLYDPKILCYSTMAFLFFSSRCLFHCIILSGIISQYAATLLCFFSLYFFYKASGFFVVMVILSAIADFILSNAIYRQQRPRRKILLIISIIFNLGVLCYFKYTNFFLSVSNDLFHTGFNPLNILLPIGISFYTI